MKYWEHFLDLERPLLWYWCLNVKTPVWKNLWYSSLEVVANKQQNSEHLFLTKILIIMSHASLSRYVNWRRRKTLDIYFQIFFDHHVTHIFQSRYANWNNKTLNIYFLAKNLIIMSRTKRTNFRRWYVSWVPKYFIFDFLRKFFPHLVGKPKPCLEGPDQILFFFTPSLITC